MTDKRTPPAQADAVRQDGRRKLGLLRGKAWAAPDAWDPDPELERLFYEGDPNFRSTLDDYLDELEARAQHKDVDG